VGEHRVAPIARHHLAVDPRAHEVGRLDQHDRLGTPHVRECAGHRVDVEAHPEGRIRVVLEQCLAHLPRGHRALRIHEPRDGVAPEPLRQFVGGVAGLRVGREWQLEAVGIGDDRALVPRAFERVAERTHLGFEVGVLVRGDDLRQAEVHEAAPSVDARATRKRLTRGARAHVLVDLERGAVVGGVRRHCLVARAQRRVAAREVGTDARRAHGEVGNRGVVEESVEVRDVVTVVEVGPRELGQRDDEDAVDARVANRAVRGRQHDERGAERRHSRDPCASAHRPTPPVSSEAASPLALDEEF
jgi:hypothetical protein